jgi:YHS domain-containing protein
MEMGSVARCPVCDMWLGKRSAPRRSEYKGRIYYLCSPECKKLFDMDAKAYLTR